MKDNFIPVFQSIYSVYANDEEIEEVNNAIRLNDKENLIEELLDVIQCCYGLAYTRGINLGEHIEKHNKKLLSRGHKFID